jgi:hypothetical protein
VNDRAHHCCGRGNVWSQKCLQHVAVDDIFGVLRGDRWGCCGQGGEEQGTAGWRGRHGRILLTDQLATAWRKMAADDGR